MSGGFAFVYDPTSRLAPLCNIDVAEDLFPLEVRPRVLKVMSSWAGKRHAEAAVQDGRGQGPAPWRHALPGVDGGASRSGQAVSSQP